MVLVYQHRGRAAGRFHNVSPSAAEQAEAGGFALRLRGTGPALPHPRPAPDEAADEWHRTNVAGYRTRELRAAVAPSPQEPEPERNEEAASRNGRRRKPRE